MTDEQAAQALGELADLLFQAALDSVRAERQQARAAAMREIAAGLLQGALAEIAAAKSAERDQP